MKRHHPCRTICVRSLTLCAAVLLSGCALTQQYVLDRCNSHAYVRTVVADYITTRYHSNAGVRVAVVPFSVPANVAARNGELPGLGVELAQRVQAELVATNVLPIVEVFKREDWPGKKEEFATGNFGAISSARDAGYDVVLVGRLQPPKSLDSMTIDTKLIETESGITLWYGTTTASSYKRGMNKEFSSVWLDRETPSIMDTSGIVSDLAHCAVAEMLREDVH